MIEAHDGIRVVSVCIFMRDEKIFVTEYNDKLSASGYYRPLGGAVKYGEFSEGAVRREMREEIDVELNGLKHETVIENIFEVNGLASHEIVFVFSADTPASILGKESVVFEDSGGTCVASWISLRRFERELRLVPDGLLGWIKETRRSI